MNASGKKSSNTTLSDPEFEAYLGVALKFLEVNSSIRNREIRSISPISYDQAIYFFNRAVSEKRLVREGKGSATRYVLPARKEKQR